MKVKFKTIGSLEKSFGAIADTIAEAAYRSLEETVEAAKQDGRKSIKAAGFSRRWQNALRDDMYANGPITAMKGVGAIYHKIGYAGVFEHGATLTGKPLMWVPVPGLPKRVARERLTPQLFERKVGPLFSVPGAKGTPMLWASMDVSATAARRGPPYKPVMAGFLRGASGQGKNIRAVPVFMGLRSATIKRKFDIAGAIEREEKNLPRRYDYHLRRLLRG